MSRSLSFEPFFFVCMWMTTHTHTHTHTRVQVTRCTFLPTVSHDSWSTGGTSSRGRTFLHARNLNGKSDDDRTPFRFTSSACECRRRPRSYRTRLVWIQTKRWSAVFIRPCCLPRRVDLCHRVRSECPFGGGKQKEETTALLARLA